MRPRSASGQAAPEYVAIVLVVAVVLGSAAAVTSGGLGAATLGGLRRGLCALAARTCAPLRAGADLPPCLVRAHEEGNVTRIALEFVDVGRQRRLRVETYSDGHVEVSFATGATAGLTAELGGDLQLGDRHVTAQAGVGARYTIGGGGLWRFASRAAAAAFVRAWGHRQRPVGGLLHDLHRACLPCRWLGRGPARIPEPDVTWTEHGDALEGSAGLRVGWGAEVAATMQAQTIGERRERRGGRTRYLAGSDALAAAVLVRARHARSRRQAMVVELHEDAGGRPDRVALRVVRRVDRAAAGGDRGTIEETELALPVRSSDDLGAVRALVSSLRPSSMLGEVLTMLPFLRRVEAEGTSTVRRFRVRSSTGETGIGGRNLGAGVDADGAETELVSEDVALPGLRALPRGDCTPA